MMAFSVPAQHTDSIGRNPPHEMGGRIVQHDEIDRLRAKRTLCKEARSKSGLESASPGAVDCGIE